MNALLLSSAGFALFFVTSLLPMIVVAQTSASSTYNDGSAEPREVRRERVRGYRGQSSELQQKISMLPSAAESVVLMPVLFGVGIANISPNFGDPRSGGRTHEGEDIMAVKGTPIVSPTAAVVLRTGTGSTEGNYVYTANPGGETFVYMHLDRIGEGVTSGTVLSRGSLVGYVGNTGNASGGAAHLHFEIHNNSGNAVDPFPRLKLEMPLQEKISALTAILTQTTDMITLSNFLVTNFRRTFTDALAQNIALPGAITNALSNIPASAIPISGASLPAGDLELGSTGPEVVALQTHLIVSAKGQAAARLSGAGATGNFGPLTQAALIEYQISAGITPANGYYGPATRAVVALQPTSAPASSAIPNVPIGSGSIVPSFITRDLKRGMTNAEVKYLQQLLNSRGFSVAASGPGSPGNETEYFGAATEAAVVKLQISRNISPSVGYVGPLTRAVLQTL